MTVSRTKSVIQERRDYNRWVADETLEDYALRYAPKSFRKWPEWLVANTALGGISFLALEAIGGALAINYGFTNSFWAIITVGVLIFLAGVPITYYAAKYNIDMDLLTRGAGFGYIGSTITSLIYASFTFIFFALEAAIMAQALELYFHLPLWLGYIVCSLVVIPLVFYGVTLINQLQLWTQPLWLFLMISPYIFVLLKEPHALDQWVHFAGRSPSGAAFDPILFGMAATVSFSLIAQLGEQVDYLRFLPDRTPQNQRQWWTAVLLAGPGWTILGVAKQLGGAFLVSLAVSQGVAIARAKEPVQMYLAGFTDMFPNPEVVLAITTLFVIVSQIKINVTNAYAGSLAWSNFFSRLTHSHPGRVVWLVFNVAIALVLMELGVFETLDAVLGLYSNVAIAWVGALVADLVINKPLKLSPSYVEFKRAHLYNINPVGFGATAIASLISILAFVGVWGDYARAYSSFLALGIAIILSPAIAWITQGKYYIARPNALRLTTTADTLLTCQVCAQAYEPADTAYCPVYAGPICSLCCSLDAHCHDQCKSGDASDLSWARRLAKTLFADHLSPQLGTRVVRFSLIFGISAVVIGAVIGLVYAFHQFGLDTASGRLGDGEDPLLMPTISESGLQRLLLMLYALLLLVAGGGTWWLVLSEESRELAEDELDRQNEQLLGEVRDRERAEAALQDLTRQLEERVAQRTAALSEALATLRQAQTQLVQTEKMSSLGQLVAGVAHEINNPVNFIHGNLEHADTYVRDLLELIATYQATFPEAPAAIADLTADIELDFIQEDLPKLLSSMRVGTERIRQIVLSLRVFSRVDESDLKPVNLHDGLDSTLLILGNRLKGSGQRPAIVLERDYGDLPAVECYAGQLNQVFMNLLANAIDVFDELNQGCFPGEQSCRVPTITIRTRCLGPDWVQVAIADNGPGVPPEVQHKLFDAFFTTKGVGKGTGLGLSIGYQIVTEKHGGKLYCVSQPNAGATFVIEIPLRPLAPDSASTIPAQTQSLA